LDATGVAAIFVFLVAMYIARTGHDLGSHSNVDFAVASHAKPLPKALREDAIIVTVTRDGGVYFVNTRVVPAELPDLIRKAYANGSERKVYFKADARVKYADVKAVLDQIRAAGIQDVAFLVETPPESLH
jgi:biopolymer transport protein ExbD/biopolymer transport protein TolR